MSGFVIFALVLTFVYVVYFAVMITLDLHGKKDEKKTEEEAYDVGDLRVGINLLRSCGNIAEADASREITEEHFQKAVDSLVSVQISETLKSLNDTEKALLKIISDSDKIFTAGELSELFKEKENVSYATFNRTLEKLEFLRLIDTKFTGKGSRGNSREIILRFNPCDFKL